VENKKKKKKAHLVPYEVVFPQFYGPQAEEEWNEAEERDKRPIERRRKPKKKFRIR